LKKKKSEIAIFFKLVKCNTVIVKELSANTCKSMTQTPSESLPTILIVDDVAANLQLLEVRISTLDVRIIQAVSGAEALEKVKKQELALAILDVRMPEMNGYELAMRINKGSLFGKVPVIFITAGIIDEKNLYAAYDAGAIDYINKPFKSHVLISKIKVFLELYNQKKIIQNDASKLKIAAQKLEVTNRRLKNSEEKFRSYIENAPDGVFVADETGKYIEVNNAACKITGYSKHELLKMSIQDILTGDALELGMNRFKKLAKENILSDEYAYKHKDGAPHWWTVDAVKLSDTRFLGFARDITQRKIMEDKLRDHQIELKMQNDELAQAIIEANKAFVMEERISKRYADLYEFAPSGYFTLSSLGEILDVNLAGSKMLGRERARLIKSSFGFFVSRDTLPVFNDFLQLIFSSTSKQHCKVTITTKGHKPVYAYLTGIASEDKNECLMTMIGISDIKLVEDALKVSREKYKTMLNASPDGILLIDLKGKIREISGIGLELLGIENKDEFMGKHFSRFSPSEERNTINEIIEKTISEGIAQNIEVRIKRKNANIFLSEISATLIQGSDGIPDSFMITIHDISQRKKLEKIQIHADRMASLGEMASGIAHEINQPLNTMSMVMDNMLFESSRKENMKNEYLKKKSNKIFQNITRIRNIIDHVRAFSRNSDDYIATNFDINASIRNAVSMISEQFKHLAIELRIQLDENQPTVSGNTFKFEQVVLNLLINAKDALLEKKSKHPDVQPMFVEIKSYRKNQSFVIEVIDNGTGISEEDIEHIMLPFYTTKDTGKGTGLGLSISYQIIKEMNGSIEISDNVYHGTTFKILLNS